MAKSFPNKVVYMTGDNSQAKELANTGVTVMIEYGTATTEEIQQLEAEGVKVGIWASPGTNPDYVGTLKGAADQAQQLGIPLVAQVESTDQQKAFDESGIAGVDVPKAIITTGNYTGSWPPGWGAMFEFYQNDPATEPDGQKSTVSKQNLADWIRTVKSEGADFVNVTIGSYSLYIPMDQYEAEIKWLQLQGLPVDGISSYAWDQMTADQKKAFLDWASQFNPTGGGQGPPPPPSGGNNPPPKEKKSPKTGSSSGSDGGKKQENPLGIDGPHQKPGADGAPPAYTGGNSPIVEGKDKTYSFTDKQNRRVTITTTADGAQFEQVEGKSAYRIKSAALAPGEGGPPPPPPTNTDPKFEQMVKKDTEANDGQPPAYRTNSGWNTDNNKDVGFLDGKTTPDGQTFDQSKVLETRPGRDADGGTQATIIRYADGNYYKYDPVTGQMTPAGKWGPDGQGLNGAASSDTGSTQFNGAGQSDAATGGPLSSTKTSKSSTQSNGAGKSDASTGGPMENASPPPTDNKDLAEAVKKDSASGDPSYRSNPGWGGDQSKAQWQAGQYNQADGTNIDTSKVLEMRPTSDGQGEIFRMEDGTYIKVVNGVQSSAGTWDASSYQQAAGI